MTGHNLVKREVACPESLQVAAKRTAKLLGMKVEFNGPFVVVVTNRGIARREVIRADIAAFSNEQLYLTWQMELRDLGLLDG